MAKKAVRKGDGGSGVYPEKRSFKDPEQEDDIYEADERDRMEDDEEISSREEGFVKGFESDEESSLRKKRKSRF